MKKDARIGFTGKIDGDSDPRLVIKGDYLYAENLYTDHKGVPGAAVNEAGATQVAYTLPAGGNSVVGTAEDKRGGSLIYFIYNTSGNDRILRWTLRDNAIVEIAAGSWLNLQNRIHSAHVIDGRYLCWTDGYSDRTVTPLTTGGFAHAGVMSITGNEPRKLDMLKSQVATKQLSYELYAGIAGNGQFALNKEYIFTVKNLAGATIVTDTFIADGTDANDPVAGLAWLADQLDSGFSSDINIVICDCKLQLEMLDAGFKFELSSDDDQVLLVPDNHYTPTLTNMETWMISLLKQPPSCAPVPTYIGMDDVAYNNVRDGCFQFRARYIYENGEQSAWSAISVTPLNNAQLGGPQESLNAISVDFSDLRLNDTLWLGVIKSVEIAFRNGNHEPFRLIKRIPVCEIGSVAQKLIFLNDGLYSVVPSDDVSISSEDIQVLVNDQNVPRRCGGMTPIAGEDGHIRLALAAPLQGYDCPDCIDASATAAAYENDDLVDIRGVVEFVDHPDALNTDIWFPHYELQGFVVYLAGTDYYAISNNPADGSGNGEFIIKNVPRGIYSIRVASYLCRFNNDFGPRYNMQNGREWQRTSAPCIEVAGSLTYHGSDYWGEREVDLYGFIGAQFDLETETGYGNISIQKVHNSATSGGDLIRTMECYAIDNGGEYDTLEKRVAAISTERIAVRFYTYDSDGTNPVNGTVVRSDHNGYSYLTIEIGLSKLWRPVIVEWSGTQVPGAVPYAIYGGGNSARNGWQLITGDTATDREAAPIPDTLYIAYGTNVGDTGHAFCFQHNPVWTEEVKQTISGRCVDSNGLGLSSVLIWMVSNGRPEYTNAFGEFSFVFYGDDTPVRVGAQKIYATYLGDIAGDFPSTPAFDGATYTIDDDADGFADPYETADFVFAFSGGIVFDERFLKSGGIYGVGVVYEDDGGRSCGVSPIETVRIPFHTSDGQYVPRTINWAINSIPPLWATKYRIVRTKDSFYLTYRQSPVGQVRYAVIADGATIPTITTYGAGNATHILLSVSAKLDDAELPAGTTLLMFRGPRKEGYRAKSGDHVRYLLDEFQDTVFSDRVLEVDVEGEYLDNGDYAVIIPYTEITREVKTGWVFEFFTPKGVEEQIYYETGVCLEIVNAGFSNRYHKGITQDQSFSPDLPATGPIYSGDTYWWRENFVFSSDFTTSLAGEHYRRSLFLTDACGDIGRAFAYDPNSKETFFDGKVMASGLYASGSQINDFNKFGLLDYHTVNRDFGAVKWIGMVHTVLLVICQNKSQPMYVGKGRVVDLSSNELVGRVNALFTLADETVASAGTLHPESVVCEDGHAYWWDLQNGVMWRFGQDGTRDIGEGRRKFFRQKQEERMGIYDRQLDVVVGGYDRKHDLVLMTFHIYSDEGGNNSAAETLGFDAVNGGWKSHFTWHPECYGRLNEDLIVFINSNFYRMYRNAATYSHVATQHTPTITFPVNDDPFTMKDWFCIRIRGNQLWFAPLITTATDAEFPNGMKSKLLLNRWTLAEGTQFAEFLRDANDPHAEFLAIVNVTTREATAMLKGRPLKGDCLVVKIQSNAPTKYNILSNVVVTFGDSQITS